MVAEVFVRAFIPVRNVGPTFTEFDPVYGKRLKANFQGTRVTPEFSMELTTNQLGHRGPPRTALPEGAILFLGDSFTMGYGVNDDEVFVSLISERLQGAYSSVPDVINLGIGNLGNGRWLKFLKQEGREHNPALIVLQLTGNDFADNRRENLFEVDESGNLAEFEPAETGTRTIQKIVEAVPGITSSYLFAAARQASQSLLQSAPEPTAATRSQPTNNRPNNRRFDLTYKIIDQIIEWSAQNSVPLITFVVAASPAQLEGLEPLFSRRNLPLITAPAKEDSPDLYYETDGHWNAAGHRHIADVLYPSILKAIDLN